MTYTWFFIFNLADFEALGLPSRTYSLILEGIGQRDILVTKGDTVGMLYEGVFLAPELNGQNPFALDGHAAYLDTEGRVWLGIAET